jgi:hypothetical protein
MYHAGVIINTLITAEKTNSVMYCGLYLVIKTEIFCWYAEFIA